MNDSDKDWKACAYYCMNKAAEAEARGGEADDFTDRDWTIMALACWTHHDGAGWSNIRRRYVPQLESVHESWLHRWTT